MRISNIIQACIQRWLNVTGKKVDFDTYPFLKGPMATNAVIGEDFYQYLAQATQLKIDHTTHGGLLQDFDKVLDAKSPFLTKLDTAITAFYEHTANYQMDVWAKWNPPISWFAKLLIRSVSVHMQQLNIPLDAMETSHGMSSNVIHLSNTKKNIHYACWLRKSVKSNKVVYAGFYSSVPTDNATHEYVRVVFPLPKGNVTVLLRVELMEDGSVQLISDGKRFGETGYYRLHTNKKGVVKARMIPIKEVIHVYTDAQDVLRTDHFFKWWTFQFLQLHYKMNVKEQNATAVFTHEVKELLRQHQKALALVRIPNAAGSKHYFFIEDPDLKKLINHSNEGDSITVFKTIEMYASGVVTDTFITTTLNALSTYNFDSELLIIADTFENYHKQRSTNFEYIDSKETLLKIVNQYKDTYISIVREPDFCDEKNTFHLHIPDENGIRKRGYSY